MNTVRLITFLFLLGCTASGYNKRLLTPKLKNIKIINIDGYDREVIADLIMDITKCNPRVVGINALFEGTNEVKTDTKLANAIQKAGNVVLVTVIENKRLTKSNYLFSEKAIAQGVVTYGYSEDDGLTYEVFHSYEDQLLWSFPAIIVSQYDPNLGLGLINSFDPNRHYKFQIKWLKEDIVILDKTNIDCFELTNSIVLLGDVGPSVPSEYIIDSSGKKEYSTIIIANILGGLIDQ